MKYYLYAAFQKLIEKRRKNCKGIGACLMFHEVKPRAEDIKDMRFGITLDSFERLLKSLIDWVIIKPEDMNHMTNYFFIILTFDDVFEDVYTHCFELLKKYKVPFTIFIATDYLDKEAYLKTYMLKELSTCNLCTIGPHTVTHCRLRMINTDLSFCEMLKSKRIIERITGLKVNCFAYPYGDFYSCGRKDIKNAKKVGFQQAFTTLNSVITSRDVKMPHSIPRINVNEDNYEQIIRQLQKYNS